MSEYQTTERSPGQHYVEPGEEVTNVEPARATIEVTIEKDDKGIFIAPENHNYNSAVYGHMYLRNTTGITPLNDAARRLLEPPVPSEVDKLAEEMMVRSGNCWDDSGALHRAEYKGYARVAVRFAVKREQATASYWREMIAAAKRRSESEDAIDAYSHAYDMALANIAELEKGIER